MSEPESYATPVWNRPGLPALAYLAGTHQQFLDLMLARLSQQDAGRLAALTTREPDDPAIALFDAWAVVGDVLTFYQERIANEGFLRTATEHESLLRLGRLVGHRPRPALAASVHLAYALDPGASCVVPAGSQVRSEPEPGGLPLVFETVKDLTARAEWNRLPVRTTGPAGLPADLAVHTPSVTVDGVAPTLRPGDRLLFSYPDARLNLTRVVGGTEPDPAGARTLVRLRVPDATRQLDGAVEALQEDMEEAARRAHSRGPFEELLSLVRDLRGRVEELRDPDTLTPLLDRGLHRLRERLAALGGGAATDALADRTAVRLATVQHAVRRLVESPAGEEAPAVAPVPETVTRPEVQRFRVTAAPLGASVPDDERVRRLLRAAVRPRSDGTAPLAADVLLLDAVHEQIEPGSWLAVRVVGRPRVRVVRVVEVDQLSVANDVDGVRVTRLRLAGPWTEDCDDVATRRATTVWAAGEPIALAAAPDPTDVTGEALLLDGVFDGLAPGRLLIVAGERTDVAEGAVSGGAAGCELAVLGGLRQDGVGTTLSLAAPLAHRYRRSTVVVYGNVVAATAGETVDEVLGSGDSGRAGQVLPLRQGPLVWLPSATVDGGEEALTVRVDGVAWQRTPDLGDAGPAAQAFQLRPGPDGRASVEFGDGVRGARLPSGIENVTARYRVGGGGRAGNVAAGRISQVVSRPPGVSRVSNPLPATGGADADGPDQLRRAISLRLAAFDRLVSVRDYESFTLAFAGVDKAAALRCLDGGHPVLHVTLAAADDAPLNATSALLVGLRAALRRYGDPALPVRVEPCERVRLVVVLGVRTAPGHLPEQVERRVRAALLARLGFAGAQLAQPVYLSAVVAAAHSVTGVDFVRVDAFDGVREGADPDGVARIVARSSVVSCVPALPAGPRAGRRPAPPAPAPGGSADHAPTVVLAGRRGAPDRPRRQPPRLVLRPAQLVLLDPAVPGTLILRRIP
ncbi:putative baseplate assembly protein [Streptomyces sp. NPDC020412]|uniref:putative baseplate assembly protein n=1 Tax=Streptomyces sp. NPDC020412 TaxID=3365073 RepID=UPI00379F028A